MQVGLFPQPTSVLLHVSIREAQILTALVGGVANFEGPSASPTSECIEELFCKLQDAIGHTRPIGETFHTLFDLYPDEVRCRQ